MKKILTAAQVTKLDQYTIRNESISSIDLMERASCAFFNWFVPHYRAAGKIGIVCGTGNNGGDGLAIARLLAENKFSINVFVVRGSSIETPDFTINLKRLDGKVVCHEISPASGVPGFEDYEVLIDAIFGSGVSRPITGIHADVIEKVNSSSAIRIAVDMPSGVLADQSSSGCVVRAHQTISFQTPKLAFLLPENNKYVGDWTVLDIGLSKSFIDSAESAYFLLDEQEVGKIIRPRAQFSHKGTFGHALLIAGSLEKMGAGILCAKPAMRSGVGLLTIHVPKSGNDVLHVSVPEAMTSIDENGDYFSSVPERLMYQSIGIGPGIGQHQRTVIALGKLLEKYRQPMVIDADAINILSANRNLISFIFPGSIVTPHPKEFERLVGTWTNDFERLEKQKTFSLETKAIVILKGAYTSISLPNGTVYFNPTGNPGMATGGSGDVLTGILTGLLAQGYPPSEAAMLGAYLHGLAGDLAAENLGMNSLIASDLIDFLPHAFKKLEKGDGFI